MTLKNNEFIEMINDSNQIEIIRSYKPDAVKQKFLKYPFRSLKIGDAILGDGCAKKAAMAFESRNEDFAFIYEKKENDKYIIIRASIALSGIAKKIGNKKKFYKYPFRNMKIGESYFGSKSAKYAALMFEKRNTEYFFNFEHSEFNKYKITRVSENDKK